MTPTSTHQAEIAVDPHVPLVRITRDFDAPPAKVLRAHTDPKLFAQWLGPRRHTTHIEHYDCRTGGSYRYVMESDGNDFGFHGSFHEVHPCKLIVQTFTFEGEPDGVALEKLTFEDLGDGRTRLTSTSLVDSFEGRDAFVASGMQEGVREGYERLDELLAADLGRLRRSVSQADGP
jgi:uncharacterized protein YndB with AHSA1/START domain